MLANQSSVFGGPFFQMILLVQLIPSLNSNSHDKIQHHNCSVHSFDQVVK